MFVFLHFKIYALISVAILSSIVSSSPIQNPHPASELYCLSDFFMFTLRPRFSCSGIGSTLGSAVLADFGIFVLLSALIYMLSQNQLAQA